MPIIVGLALVPFAYYIAKMAESAVASREETRLFNGMLILMVVGFYVYVFLAHSEPFDFSVTYSTEYMFLAGDYWIDALVVYIWAPFMWIITIHFVRLLFRAVRVKKNAVIKQNYEFLNYRDDLDKIAPGIILFASELSVDIRRCITSGILKLKVSGYVEEKYGVYFCTDKSQENLYESEKMLLRLIERRSFDMAAYCRALESEALAEKYIVRNRGGILLRLLRIIVAACMPFLLFVGSVWLSSYSYKHYAIYPEPVGDGYEVYIVLDREEDIEQLMREITDESHLHSSYSVIDGKIHYNCNWVKANQFQYRVVRKAYIINSLGNLSIGIVIFSVLPALYIIVEQIRYFNKNYRRTSKGNMLLSKAYALRNYLKKYSLMKDRSEYELALWEYYLVYAVALDVNERIEDELLEKIFAGMPIC